MDLFKQVALLLTLSLVACAPHLPDPAPKVSRMTKSAVVGATSGGFIAGVTGVGIPFGVAAGGTLGAAIGFYLDKTYPQVEDLGERLMNSGIQVFLTGEEVRIIMPEYTLFPPNAPSLTSKGYGNLNLLASYLQYYRTVNISVKGYTDDQGWAERNLSLSKARAAEVASYLWGHGLNTRMIIADGVGASDPIASNQFAEGREMNRRVEIRFRYLTPGADQDAT